MRRSLLTALVAPVLVLFQATGRPTPDDEARVDWQTSLAQNQAALAELRCGTPPPPAGGGLERVAGDCGPLSTTIQPEYVPANGVQYQIPVVVHVIEDSLGNGALSDAQVESQIDVMNEDFLALAGTNGAGGTNVRIQFYLATQDPGGGPTSGITRTTNSTWFNDAGTYWDTLAWDPDQYLNIYTNTASGFLGYASHVPQYGGAGTTPDRVVIRWEAFGRNASIGAPYHLGRTATHEVGHYLGLLHTFADGCASASLCYENGDLICDTNPQSLPTAGCPAGPTSCGSADPFDNYMDYTNDACMVEFTPEQANRMRCTLENWRPDLARPFCGVGTATAVNRNAGTNPDVLTVEPPRVGQMQRYEVTTTPHEFAVVFAYSGAGQSTLKNGQTLLVDPGSLKLFQLPILTGPQASLTVEVPMELQFCNVQATVQALLFGNVTPFSLSNAVDLTSGG